MGGHSGIPAKVHFLMFSGRETMGDHMGIPAKIHFLMFSGREATGGHGRPREYRETRTLWSKSLFFWDVRTQNAPLFWELTKNCPGEVQKHPKMEAKSKKMRFTAQNCPRWGPRVARANDVQNLGSFLGPLWTPKIDQKSISGGKGGPRGASKSVFCRFCWPSTFLSSFFVDFAWKINERSMQISMLLLLFSSFFSQHGDPHETLCFYSVSGAFLIFYFF